jgi:hypothetical protein
MRWVCSLTFRGIVWSEKETLRRHAGKSPAGSRPQRCTDLALFLIFSFKAMNQLEKNKPRLTLRMRVNRSLLTFAMALFLIFVFKILY